ncbi:MAG: YraN family protein [Clostridiales bacterium]|nr:YraN family protein [Clostridia bacterium]MCR5567440.1 YraN family protein [Clostridiales bacterium]
MKNTYETGIFGEKTASEWLEKHKGMKLLETRHRNRAGEIDLIMLDGETVAFIEVKTRLNAVPGCGLMAVDRKKQQRIARSAMLYLIEKGWLDRRIRFDAVEVSGAEVIHVPGAFQPGNMFYR